MWFIDMDAAVVAADAAVAIPFAQQMFVWLLCTRARECVLRVPSIFVYVSAVPQLAKTLSFWFECGKMTMPIIVCVFF